MIEQLNFIIPELLLAGGAMLVLMAGVYVKNHNTAVLVSTRLSSIVLLGTLLALFLGPIGNNVIFNGLYNFDNFSLIIKSLLVFSAAMVLVMSFQFIEEDKNKIGFEYPILILLSLLGMFIMVSANDFLTIYLGLEMQSLSLYILAAAKREDKNATEAGIKYFVLGALASGILLYGISLIYGYLGTTNLTTLLGVLGGEQALSQGAIVGLVFVLIGFAFKISAAPFHMWTPDVYEGVPTPVTAYFAIVPKLAAAMLFVRVLVAGPFAEYSFQWQQVVIILSVISMMVGAFGAIWQNNIKRLLAYSSIGHMGYVLLGIIANTMYGVQTVIFYFVVYILASLGIFAILLALRSGKETIEKIDDFKGLAGKHPVIALMLSLLMFSMIGLPFPPFAGFFGKFFVFGAAIAKGYYVLAVIGMITSVVAAYYYLRIVKLMYFDKPDADTRITLNMTRENAFILAIVSLLSLAIFISPSSVMKPAYFAAASLF